MARLTRIQQQQLTHQRLLDAGRLVFLGKGFLAATVDEIATEAGYTRGAVYKHFGGKEGLWCAIVDARADVMLQNLAAALDHVTTRDELLAILNPDATLDASADRWAMVSAESLAVLAGQPEHAHAVAAVQQRLDQAAAGLLTQCCQRLGIHPAVPITQLVAAWSAMGAGLTLLRIVDPATDVAGTIAGVLALLLPAPTDARTRH